MDKTKEPAHKSYPIVRPSLLATKEKLPDRLLYSSKIKKNNTQNTFLFILIEIISPWSHAHQAKDAIVGVMDKIKFIDETAPERFFEDMIIQINETLANIINPNDKGWISNLNSVIGLVHQNNIFLAQAGNVSAFVFRKGKISSITEKPGLDNTPDPSCLFSDITSGKVIADDRVIIANSELYNHLSLDRLRRLSENQTSPLIIAELFKMLRRTKVLAINVIALEVSNGLDIEGQVIENPPLPEISYLDEALVTPLARLKKALGPAHQTVRKLGKETSERTTVIADKTRVGWHKHCQPKVKLMLNSGKKQLLKMHKQSLPALKKIGLDQKAQIIGTRISDYSKKSSQASPMIKKALSAIHKLILLAIEPKNRKYAYGLLIALLVLAGYLKIKSNNDHRVQINEQRAISSAYDDATNLYQEARDAIALGKSDGQTKLINALVLAQKAQDDEPNRQKAIALTKEIQAEIDKSSKTSRSYDLKPLFSLGTSSQIICLVGSEIYGAGSDGKIYKSDTRDNEPKLVGSINKELGTPKSIAYSKSDSAVFVSTDSNHLFSINTESNAAKELLVIEGTNKWESTNEIASFVSNLYILDSESGKIWKHVKKDNDFAKGSSYLNTDSASIRGATDFAVDGDIFVLQNDGSVLKFVKGVKDTSFTLGGIPSPDNTIAVPGEIVTDSESTSLFILDKKLNRIINFDKSGSFVKQYAFDNLTVDRFVANSKLQKLWLLSKGSIYEINL